MIQTIAFGQGKKRSFRRLAKQALRDMIIYGRTCAKQNKKVCIAGVIVAAQTQPSDDAATKHIENRSDQPSDLFLCAHAQPYVRRPRRRAA